MVKRLLVFAVLALMGITLFAGSALAENKVSVAILPFKEGQLTNWGWDWSLPEGITNLVIDEVVKRNKLSVVERTRVEELMSEQSLAADGRIEAETASQIGKLLGARLLVMGTITQFDFKQSGGIGISFLRVSGSMAQVKLTGRVVDSQTGVVLGSFEGEGSKTGTSFSVNSYKGISIDGEQFQGTTLGQATYVAVGKFADELTKVTEKVAAQVGVEEARLAQSGKVVAVLGGDQIVIDLGSKHGVRLNTIVNIDRLQSIKGLKNPVRVPVGTAKVISVEEEASVLKLEGKTDKVQEGDVVTMQ